MKSGCKTIVGYSMSYSFPFINTSNSSLLTPFYLILLFLCPLPRTELFRSFTTFLSALQMAYSYMYSDCSDDDHYNHRSDYERDTCRGSAAARLIPDLRHRGGGAYRGGRGGHKSPSSARNRDGGRFNHQGQEFRNERRFFEGRNMS